MNYENDCGHHAEGDTVKGAVDCVCGDSSSSSNKL